MRNRKKRRAWAASDVREMKRLAKKKTPASKIARSLKRTEGATRQKAFSIGLSLEFASLRSLPTFSRFTKPRKLRGFSLLIRRELFNWPIVWLGDCPEHLCSR